MIFSFFKKRKETLFTDNVSSKMQKVSLVVSIMLLFYIASMLYELASVLFHNAPFLFYSASFPFYSAPMLFIHSSFLCLLASLLFIHSSVLYTRSRQIFCILTFLFFQKIKKCEKSGLKKNLFYFPFLENIFIFKDY